MPTLVFLHTIPDAEIAQLTALEAFRSGYASPGQFDILLDTRDLLFLSAKARGDEEVLKVCAIANDVLGQIRASWEGDRFATVDADSLNTLQVLVDISSDWWKRQSGVMYQRAYTVLKDWRQHQNDSGRNHESQSDGTRTDQTGLVCS
jgi:hypothetical protein